MNKVKRLVLIAMTITCMFAMVSCGDNSNKDESSTTQNQNTQTTNDTADKTDKAKDADSTDKVYEQDFTLVNDTGVEIYELYISPSQQNQWGSDVLTVDTLPSGQSVQIKFEPKETSQYWDLMIVDSEGTSVTWPGIDLFTISEVSLQFDGTTPTASFK